MRLEAEHFHNW